MATIPGIDNLGGRPSLQSSRPAVENRSNMIEGKSIADAGEAMIRTGQAVQSQRDDFSYQIAKSKLLELDIKVSREVQQMDDFSSWDREYQSRMAKGKAEILKTLRNPQHQAYFDEESNITIGRGSGAMFADAFKREADVGRADMTSTLVRNRELYLEAKTPAQRQEILMNTHSVIAGAAKQKYITDEEAVRMRETSAQDFGGAWVEMLGDYEKINVLQNPTGTPAEMMPIDDRKRALDAALQKTEAERLLAVGYAAAERFDPSASYAANKARMLQGITGAKERKAVEGELASMWQERGIAANDMYNQLYDAMQNDPTFDWNAVRATKGVYSMLNASEQESLDAHWKQKKEGGVRVHSDAAWTELVMRAARDPESLKNANPLKWRNVLDDQHYDAAVQMIADINGTGDGSGKSITAGMADLDSIITDYAGGVPERRANQGLEFNTGMQVWALNKFNRDGVWPSRLEMRNEAAERAVQVYVTDPDKQSWYEGGWSNDPEDQIAVPAFALKHKEGFDMKVESMPSYTREKLSSGIELATGSPVDMNNVATQETMKKIFFLTNMAKQIGYDDIPEEIRAGIEQQLSEEAYGGQPFDPNNEQHVADLINTFRITFD